MFSQLKTLTDWSHSLNTDAFTVVECTASYLML
jgi:hypothetical protein